MNFYLLLAINYFTAKKTISNNATLDNQTFYIIL